MVQTCHPSQGEAEDLEGTASLVSIMRPNSGRKIKGLVPLRSLELELKGCHRDRTLQLVPGSGSGNHSPATGKVSIPMLVTVTATRQVTQACAAAEHDSRRVREEVSGALLSQGSASGHCYLTHSSKPRGSTEATP